MMGGVAIYIRWSTEDQGQGTTLDVQLEACRKYCDQQGWYVPDDFIYVDEGYSGGTLDRPAMARLRADVASGRVKVVVSYRLDRLSRNLADATNLVDREWKNRAVVRSATEEVLPEQDEGWLNYSFRATFADYERRVIRQRTLAGKLRRLREGRKVHGRAPYGWRNSGTPGFLVLDESAAEVVRTMFHKCARENMGAPALARWLNETGIKSPGGKKWSAPHVATLLANPIYGGTLVYGARKRVKQSREEPGPWDQRQAPVVEAKADPGCVPPIIRRELWEEVQEAIRERRGRFTRGRGVTHPRLLTGLLYCQCGGSLTPKVSVSRKGKQPTYNRYYRCWRDTVVERCPLQPGFIDAETLEQYVEQEFLRRVEAVGFRTDIVDKMAANWQGEGPLLRSQLGQLKEVLTQQNKRLAFVDREYLLEAITAEEARRLRAVVNEEKAMIQRRISEVEEGLRRNSQRELHLVQLRSQLKLIDRWKVLSVLQQKEVLRHFIHRIEAFRARNSKTVLASITWTFEPDTSHKADVPSRPNKTRTTTPLGSLSVPVNAESRSRQKH